MSDFEISRTKNRDKWWVCYFRRYPNNGPPYRERSAETDLAQGVRIKEGKPEDEWLPIAVKVPKAPARNRARAERIARGVIEEMENP